MQKLLTATIIIILQCAAIVAVAKHSGPISFVQDDAISSLSVATSIRPQPRPRANSITDAALAEEVYCMAEALYWEGRNQTHEAQQAIGNAIQNRVASNQFPNTVCGVVHQGPQDGSQISLHRCQFSYYCDGRSDDPAKNTNIIEQRAWAKAREMAFQFVAGEGYEDITNGSDHYLTHAAANSPSAPNWSKVYTRVASIGDHLFYVRN